MNIITERKQVGDLYHFTYIDNLFSIVKSNSLKPANDTEYNNGVRMHFISMTRSKTFSSDAGFECDVRFKINGTKLSDKYKIRPFNYYSGMQHYGDYSPNDSEMEERIWFEEGKYISNFLSYVKQIDLLDSISDINNIVLKLKELTNIQVNVVKNWRQ